MYFPSWYISINPGPGRKQWLAEKTTLRWSIMASLTGFEPLMHFDLFSWWLDGMMHLPKRTLLSNCGKLARQALMSDAFSSDRFISGCHIQELQFGANCTQKRKMSSCLLTIFPLKRKLVSVYKRTRSLICSIFPNKK